jgi:hypothetical protein
MRDFFTLSKTSLMLRKQDQGHPHRYFGETDHPLVSGIMFVQVRQSVSCACQEDGATPMSEQWDILR